MEFELKKDEGCYNGIKGWTLVSSDENGSAESHFTSRRKALLSVVRRIELLKPSAHFKLSVEIWRCAHEPCVR